MFRFALYKKLINTIWYLFYEQKSLLFLAKIGFGKSFIFQLLLFITLITDIFFILIFLKLFQIK